MTSNLILSSVRNVVRQPRFGRTVPCVLPDTSVFVGWRVRCDDEMSPWHEFRHAQAVSEARSDVGGAPFRFNSPIIESEMESDCGEFEGGSILLGIYL